MQAHFFRASILHLFSIMREMILPDFIAIKNWTKYQHYKRRNPPWVKLHCRLLNSSSFARLQDASKAHFMYLLILAAQSDNKISNDIRWIKSYCNLKKTPDFTPLFEADLIEAWDGSASILHQNAPSETETYSSQRHKHKQSTDSVPSSTVGVVVKAGGKKRRADPAPEQVWHDGINRDAWTEWCDYKLKVHKEKYSALAKYQLLAQAKLVEVGDHAAQQAAVNHSMAKGWKGVFADKEAHFAKMIDTTNMSIEQIKALAKKS